MSLDPLHAQIIAIAAALPEARTIALAGGGAMLAHDIVDRATKDVDLFTDRDAAEAVAVAAALRVALEAAGFSIRPAPVRRTRTGSSRSGRRWGRRCWWRSFPTAGACTIVCS